MDLAYFPVDMYDDETVEKWSYVGWYAIESDYFGGVIGLACNEILAKAIVEALEPRDV